MNVITSRHKNREGGYVVHGTVPAHRPELGYLLMCTFNALGWHTVTDRPIDCKKCLDQIARMAK